MEAHLLAELSGLAAYYPDRIIKGTIYIVTSSVPGSPAYIKVRLTLQEGWFTDQSRRLYFNHVYYDPDTKTITADRQKANWGRFWRVLEKPKIDLGPLMSLIDDALKTHLGDL